MAQSLNVETEEGMSFSRRKYFFRLFKPKHKVNVWTNILSPPGTLLFDGSNCSALYTCNKSLSGEHEEGRMKVLK